MTHQETVVRLRDLTATARPVRFRSFLQGNFMKKNPAYRSAFFNPRFLVGSAFCSAGLFLLAGALLLYPGAITEARGVRQEQANAPAFSVVPSGNVTTAGQLIISEYRVRGFSPNPATNEYVELYNATEIPLTVQSADGSPGLAVAASDGVLRCLVPNGTIIPARGHFLCTNSGSYALGGYPSGTGATATGDQTFAIDIPDQAGIALFNNATGGASFSMANRLDAVGPTSEADSLYREGAGLAALTPFSIDSAWIRRFPGGCISGSGANVNCTTVNQTSNTPGPTSTRLQDTDDNEADFIFVDTNGTSSGGGQRLGAPGPQNLAAPRVLDGVLTNITSVDSCVADTEAPNYVRETTPDPSNNSTFGTIDIRKTFINTTGAPITRLRFRVVELTTFPAISGTADLRPRTSNDLVVTVDRPPCGSGTSNVTVRGTTLEVPPAQQNGGGYNSSMSVTTIDNATPLANGASIDVRFLLGVQQNGVARFCVAPETEPASASQVACFITPPSCTTTIFSQNFDGVTPPALPSGWVSSLLSGPANCTPTGTCALGTQWTTNTTTPDSAPNSVFHNDPSCVTDTTLDSTSFPVTSPNAQLTFRNSYNLETNYDGGVLEISLGGGAFTDILAAGGTFVTGGYSSTIATQFHSPIAGRMAWSGNSGGFVTTTVHLPSSAAGQDVKLRFRIGTDCSVSGTGWRIDTVSVSEGQCDTATALNISTRMNVQTGNNVLIGGFIVAGSAAKQVVIRGVGPSLIPFGITNALMDPTLELRGADGTVLAVNDDWQSDATQASLLNALGLGLQDPRESGIAATLHPGDSYTAILAGKDGGTGVGLVEIYDANGTASSQFANISTRGFVLTESQVMIGGFILGGQFNTGVIVRGVGPSLAQFGIDPVLADPTLELRDQNGALLVANDNWQDDPTQAAQLTSHNLGLEDTHEAGIFADLPPGSFTAILAGKNGGTGIGLVEIYNVH